MSFYKESSNYQQSKANASQRKSNQQRPLNSSQLHAVMCNVFAWMTVGLGISAWVASLLSQGESDAFTIFSVFVIATILQLGLAFALYGALPTFSPKRASFFFIFYSVVAGANFSLLVKLLNYPNYSGTAIAACLSVLSLFAAMTLIAWKSKFDFSERASYLLMGVIGLPVALAVNVAMASDSSGSGGHSFLVSLISVVLFSALTAYMTQPIARISADPHRAANPDDAVRFSIQAALKLYLSISVLSLVLPIALLQRLVFRGYGYHGTANYLFGDLFGDEFSGVDDDFGSLGDDFGDLGGDPGGLDSGFNSDFGSFDSDFGGFDGDFSD